MSWLNKQVSFYKCTADNAGYPATYRDILFCLFGVEHEWFYKDRKAEKWVSGVFNDLDTIIDLRTREMAKEEKVTLKNTMQCFTPAALLKTKKQGKIEEINRTGILQLDFDAADIKQYDIEELKQSIFSLPFVAFCGLSCSGQGFYALALIAEPDRLEDYAEHCFEVLREYGIPPDTTKGRNVNDLRFVSYDANMLIRENPEPLKIKNFRTKDKPQFTTTTSVPVNHADKVVSKGLTDIRNALEGRRWQTVQKVAYTLGGLGDHSVLNDIEHIIKSSSQFTGVEEKYCQCAADCFNAGKQKPLVA